MATPYIVLDDLSTGSIRNIEHLKGDALFHYAIGTVMNEPLLAEMVDDCDVVVHLAAAVGVRLIVEEPVHTIETNVHGTEVVLKHASKKRPLVMIVSTSEVYGKSAAIPFREDADLVLGPTVKHQSACTLQQADRSVPGARVYGRTEATGGDRSSVQHSGASSDRPIRYGHSAFRAPGTRR